MTCLSRHVLEVRGQPTCLVHGLLDRLAHFLRRGTGHELLVVLQKLDELHQVVGALDGGNLLPGLLRLVGCLDGGVDVILGCHGELGNDLFGRGVDVLAHLTIAVVKELAVDIELNLLHVRTSY